MEVAHDKVLQCAHLFVFIVYIYLYNSFKWQYVQYISDISRTFQGVSSRTKRLLATLGPVLQRHHYF